jgi:2-polyprenyl-6-methoxyphenol hydroxylase-like FAD-dependent oxidoreductase
MEQRVLVSGAGIAGCAVTYWLRRHGHEVTMVERAAVPRPGGQTVDLRGAGRTVVERMGLLDRVREVTVDQRGIAWVDERGRRRAEMAVEAFGGRGIVSRDEVLRGDLAEVLYDAAASDVDVRFDDTITSLTEVDGGVDVEFEQSAAGRFDLVVGADGLRSAVRRLAFGPDAELIRPLGLLTAWFTVPAEVDLDGWFLQHNARGGRVVSLRPGRLPTEQKAGLSVRTRPVPERAEQSDQRALLGRQFADVGWAGRRLAEHAQTAPDFFAEHLGQVVLPHPTRGRVALVGDAGYCPSPITGLGTSLALVGGYVLAGELWRAGPAGIPTALERYEQTIRDYVRQAQELPPGGLSGYAPRTPWGIAMNQASMRSATRWPMRVLMDRILAKADAIDLPDYAA